MNKTKPGKIIYPPGRFVEDYEKKVAKILAKNGETVEFLKEGNIRMADIIWRGAEWEIKAPEGGSSRTLENNMRLAFGQSRKIIIYLGRIKIPENKCLMTIKNRAKKLGKKYKIIVILSNEKILGF